MVGNKHQPSEVEIIELDTHELEQVGGGLVAGETPIEPEPTG